MTQSLKIDFVSDVACPWCIIGLRSLQEALNRVSDSIRADVAFQPFELNPDMPPEGEDAAEHVARKFGGRGEQLEAGRAMLQSRAAELGFELNFSGYSRIHNTFDAHRLLYWANSTGRQQQLKLALFKANFTDCTNIADPDVLIAAAKSAGLDGMEAQEILATGRYGEEVRAAEQLWLSRGIASVPSIVINDKWLISGGQPVEVFEQALRRIATEAARPAAVN
jgi:predicted DsbA family dithiol-disulfide isomerase